MLQASIFKLVCFYSCYLNHLWTDRYSIRQLLSEPLSEFTVKQKKIPFSDWQIETDPKFVKIESFVSCTQLRQRVERIRSSRRTTLSWRSCVYWQPFGRGQHSKSRHFVWNRAKNDHAKKPKCVTFCLTLTNLFKEGFTQ